MVSKNDKKNIDSLNSSIIDIRFVRKGPLIKRAVKVLGDISGPTASNLIICFQTVHNESNSITVYFSVNQLYILSLNYLSPTV